MMNSQQLAQSLNILAIFFRYPPCSDEFNSICQYFQTDWQDSWGAELLKEQDYSPLKNLKYLSTDIWKQHFGIEYNLYAPPWGSVYTDPEKLLYGETTIKLQNDVRSLGLKFCSGEKEPLDHIGLILMIMAHIALHGKAKDLKSFTSAHLTPWATEYIYRLKQSIHDESLLTMVKLFEETLEHFSFKNE